MKEQPWAGDELKIRELIAEEAALMSLRGIGINEQAKQLTDMYQTKVTRSVIERLRKHPKYLEIKEKTIEAAFKEGTLDVKKMGVDLLPDLQRCLKSKLAENDMKAATIVLSIFTGNKDQEGPQQAQQLNITLATDTPPKIIS